MCASVPNNDNEYAQSHNVVSPGHIAPIGIKTAYKALSGHHFVAASDGQHIVVAYARLAEDNKNTLILAQ